MSYQKIIFSLMGPTASGKTQAAMELFQEFHCEIVSVDSAMVYRGMDIGTAKPTREELSRAPHRLIDICDPLEAYSVGQFCEDALREATSIHQNGHVPLLVGGTMLYFNRLQYGIADLPQADESIRQALTDEAKRVGWSAMHEKLKDIDETAAERIHPNDAQRIQRALEVYASTGQTLSDLRAQQQKNQATSYQFINMILAPEDRAPLRARIAKRFEAMLQKGLIEEVEGLRQRGDLTPDLSSMRTVGYRQVWSYLSGEVDFETMKAQAITATCQLAKRQFTWLRRWPDAIHFNSEDPRVMESLKAFVKSQLEK